MPEEGLNYTPLSTLKVAKQKKFFLFSNKILVALILSLTVGIGMVSYLLILRRPIRPRVPAYLSGEATACDIKLGPPIAGSDKVEGNKYSIQVPIENKSTKRQGARLTTGWYACPYNDKQTCQEGDGHTSDADHILAAGEKKIITVTAEQSAGACGSLQIDLRIKAVKKNIEDDSGGDNVIISTGESMLSSGSSWDETCNTTSTWVGGFYTFAQACGIVPTTPPTPTPTTIVATITPTTPEVGPSLTPTPPEIAGTITPTAGGPTATTTPTKTLTPTLTLTPSPTETAIFSPTPTSGTLAQGVSATPIPVACGTKSCDDTTNPCRSGLVCVQAQDGSNYCSLPEFQDSCIENPSQTSCCTAPGTNLTPTEIVLVNASVTAGAEEAATTLAAKVTEIPPAGVAAFGKILAVISVAVILLGLLL